MWKLSDTSRNSKISWNLSKKTTQRTIVKKKFSDQISTNSKLMERSRFSKNQLKCLGKYFFTHVKIRIPGLYKIFMIIKSFGELKLWFINFDNSLKEFLVLWSDYIRVLKFTSTVIKVFFSLAFLTCFWKFFFANYFQIVRTLFVRKF